MPWFAVFSSLPLGREQRPGCALEFILRQSPKQIDPSSISESITPSCEEHADFAVNWKKLCKQTHAWTITPTVLIFPRMTLRKIHHLADRTSNTFLIVFLAFETL